MPLAEAEALSERALTKACSPGPCGLEDSTNQGNHPTHKGSGYSEATIPEPYFQAADVKADVAGLRQLALACERFTPQFGIEESESPESLLLDMTGGTHLFGGKHGTVLGIVNDFRERGFQAHVSLTPTVGAAWAAAHFLAKPAAPSIVEPPGLLDALKPLPVESLRLTPAMIATLHELGLRTVGQLRALPRASLPSRFGPLLLKRLDQAFGDEPELLLPEKPREPLIAGWAGEFPITDRESLHVVASELLDQLLNRLQPRREGVRQLRCELRDSSGRLHEFRVGFVAPTNQVKHVLEMLCLQWERVALPDEIVLVRLEATATDPLHVVQRDLFGHELDTDSQHEVVLLLDRLSNRLGSHAVVRARLLPEAQPELVVAHEPWVRVAGQGATALQNESPPRSPGWLAGFCTTQIQEDLSRAESREPPGQARWGESPRILIRPLRLFSPPQPIEVSIAGPEGAPLSFWWNRREHRVTRSWGPERIETGWWRESSACRDYFRVEVQTGHHFWIFRRLDERGWFIHGTFD